MKFLLALFLMVTCVKAKTFDLLKFDDHLAKDDFKAAEAYLDEFKNASLTADIEAARAQFMIESGKKDALTYKRGKTKDSVMATTDKKGNATGYLNYKEHTDEAVMIQGVAEMRNVIARYPNRIDLRFWLADFYRIKKDYKMLNDMAIDIFEQSGKNDNAWLTLNDKSVTDGKEYVMGNLQGKVHRLFQLDTPAAEAAVISLGETMIKYRPDHIYGYNNLGGIHLYNKRYAQALPHLEKAHQIDSTDDGAMKNLGLTYQRLGNKKAARNIYELILKHKNTRFHSWAAEKLKEL